MIDGMEQIGTIFVDAGLCWIGDPCYVFGDGATSRVHKWSDFCEAVDAAGHDARGHSAPLKVGTGFAVSTAHGDGEYPVYIRRNTEGRVSEVRVLFDDQNTDEDDC